MPDKKSRNKQNKTSDNRDAIRRRTWIRIVLIGFSIILILSIILSLAATTT
jgi:hypothetical protein